MPIIVAVAVLDALVLMAMVPVWTVLFNRDLGWTAAVAALAYAVLIVALVSAFGWEDGVVALSVITAAAAVAGTTAGLVAWFRRRLMSPAEKAYRAAKAGDLATALGLFAVSDAAGPIRYLIQKNVPYTDLQGRLCEAAGQVLALRRAAATADRAGLPAAMARAMAAEAETAGSAVWRSAARVAAVAAQRVATPEVQAALVEESQDVEALAAAARQARESLARLTLSRAGDAELTTARVRLQAMGEAADALADGLGDVPGLSVGETASEGVGLVLPLRPHTIQPATPRAPRERFEARRNRS